MQHTIKLGLIDVLITFGRTALLRHLGIASRQCMIEGLIEADNQRKVTLVETQSV